MERIKIRHLKLVIDKARAISKNPNEQELLEMMKKTITLCPPQYLRITKMYQEVMKIRNGNDIQQDTKIDIIQNFQETTTSRF